ncbi:MAG: DUF1028 domain-containing protein [Vallitaleaceae bacterium]|nr:DUF1028 domain-containing protein [Vallitaleaceae bacterium]
MQAFKSHLVLFLLGIQLITFGQQFKQTEPFAHTFSIVARDINTGEMAVGVQSHWFAVGTSVCWAKSGVGVVATQSFVNPAFGPQGLQLMEEGIDAKTALEQLINGDEGRDFRQLALLDKNGITQSYTGANCVKSAYHIVGENFAVQANMMLNDQVVPAMAKAFEENANLPLAERIVEVLKAAQNAGGDIRGKQSAALLVVGPEKVAEWMDKRIDLRVDDSTNPLPELSRLLKVHRAYDHMNQGDLAIEKNDMELALEEYASAEKMLPENLEMKYWKAVTLANNGRLTEALPIFKYVFSKDPNWKEMTKRLPASGLLSISESELQEIQSQ